MTRSGLKILVNITFISLILLIMNTEFYGLGKSLNTLPAVISSVTVTVTVVPTDIPVPTSSPSPSPSTSPSPSPAPSLSPSPSPQLTPDTSSVPEGSPGKDYCKVVYWGDRTKNQIALTFDDSGAFLGNILEILDERNIKGTFFLLAGELSRNPQRWQEAVSNGHHVLNHTVRHNTKLYEQSDEYISGEITGWEKVAAQILGQEYLQLMKSGFPIFRTPGGGRSDKLHRILGEHGYKVAAYWSCEDIYFPKHNTGNISMVDHYIKGAKNGAIFLMHPGTVKYLEEIISKVSEKGYEFRLLAETIGQDLKDR